MSRIEFFTILGSVGSFLSAIIMLITMIRVISRLKFNKEVIYVDEAVYRYEKIKCMLNKDGVEVKSYEYQGGSNKIIPRLEFEKCHYNPITMGRELKGYKKRVRYFYNENNKRIVRTWYLK